MTANRRIFLNIIATYGRSLFGLACGLFSARWVLEALGKEDFGLYGVVGALTIFISFLNMMLSGALGRYYAFSIGEAKKAADNGRAADGLENCRRWFNTALSIHTIVPVVLMLIGYPIGEWAVRNFLTIPADRLETCVWVFRLACISSFVGMINVPFTAMYTAKQYIAELTIYSLVQTAANTAFFYFMAAHPGAWLMKYAIWMCVVAITPQVLITTRAFMIFKECRINLAYWWDLSRFKQLGSYALWQMFGGLGYIFRTQAIAILVNKYFGPSVNAAMGIANQASSQTQTLAAAMQGAFQPAIATAFGANEIGRMRALAYRASKFAILLTLIFLIPIAVELNLLMELWLKTPPPYTVGLCYCMLAMLLSDKASTGQCLACNASGRIAAYQATGGTMLILTLPMAWMFVALGLGVYSVGIAMVVMTAANSLSRVYFARRIVGMSARYWFVQILVRSAFAAAIAVIPGLFVIRYVAPSFARICLTTAVIECLFLPLSYAVALTHEERRFVSEKIRRILRIK